MNLPDILKEFEKSELHERIINTDSMASVHGAPSYEGETVGQLISKVYAHAIQNCLEVLPVGFDTKGTLLDIYREQFEDGFNSCRTLSEQSIKSLLDKEIKE